MRWIHTCFDNLIHTLQSLNMNKQVDSVQIQLSHWLRENPKLDTTVTLTMLNEKARPFDQFMSDFSVWEKKAKKVLNFAKEMITTKEKMEKL